MNERALQIAKEMVHILSVNGTPGEAEIGSYLERLFREMPYFQKHPELLIVKELQNDPLHRKNVMALLRGEKTPCARTLLWHGHTDTVGIDDYGSLKDVANCPEELEKRLHTMNLAKEVKADLMSGDYMFGRGACDMKSGDAVFIALIEELSRHPENLSGNLLVSFNPVEENLHTGIIEGLDTLLELRDRYALKYELAINNDYICPLYEGDTVKTLYTGIVGKVLPCFYIRGKETHVGQCFEGFDACMTAAKLVEEISLNCAYADEYEGETSLPPSVLKMKDLKSWYNVQTAKESLVYFNYFLHNASMDNVTSMLLRAAEKALLDTKKRICEENSKFSRIAAIPEKISEYRTKVYSYVELRKKAMKASGMTEAEMQVMENVTAEEELSRQCDAREVPVAIVRKMLDLLNDSDAAIVLYYAPPYCPHNTMQADTEHLMDDLKQITANVSARTGENYRLMRFFPSLSDSSYFKIDDSEASLNVLKSNFPVMEKLYHVPMEKIRELNIPTADFGCYGKDAHKWTERVNIPYTFDILPQLLMETLRHFEMI